jgi:hypothetical protein
MAIKAEASQKDLTPTQLASLQIRRTALLKRLRRFQDLQSMFMPDLRPHLDSLATIMHDAHHPEKASLHLPSAFSPENRAKICSPNLVAIEDRLRYAHAQEALQDLRRQLRLRTLANNYTRSNVRSQAPYTRMRTLQEQIKLKIREARRRYRVARSSLLTLRHGGDEGWKNILRKLRTKDIRGLNERHLSSSERNRARDSEDDTSESNEEDPETTLVRGVALGEGRQTASWIWYSLGMNEAIGDVAGGMYDTLRVEWVKARACALRWKEELILLEEEMRRVLVFGTWMSSWWEQQAGRRQGLREDLAEGLAAYAAEQAACEAARGTSWAARWSSVRERAKVALVTIASGISVTAFEPISVELDLPTDLEDSLDDGLADDDYDDM